MTGSAQNVSRSARRAPVRSPFLCERCGYTREGLDPEIAKCPECGTPARDSLPARRPGTPWQMRRTPWSYLRTVYVVLGFPLSSWSDVRFTDSRAPSLLAITLIGAGALASFGSLGGVADWSYTLWFWLGFTLAISVLTLIEMLGLHVFGRRRSFRMTGNVPFVICAHAASAWWIAALGMALVFQVTHLLVRADLAIGRWLQRPVLLLVWEAPLAHLLLMGAFVVGMVSYSLLAGAGFHALRHVNIARTALSDG